MLFDSSSTTLDSNSGNVWWFHSEFTYPEGSEDGIGGIQQGPSTSTTNSTINLSKNTVQWLPFSPIDVVQLEHSYREWQEEEEAAKSGKNDKSGNNDKNDQNGKSGKNGKNGIINTSSNSNSSGN